MQRLEDADQERDSRQSVLDEFLALRMRLPSIAGRRRGATEQLPRIGFFDALFFS